MLQQTLIKVVIPKYVNFIARFPSVQSLAAATEEDLRQAVAGDGVLSTVSIDAKCSKKADCRFSRSQNSVAKDHRWSSILPGIGPYTAAAIGSIAFHCPEPVVDGNVQRVLCRLFKISEPVNVPSLNGFYAESSRKLLCTQMLWRL